MSDGCAPAARRILAAARQGDARALEWELAWPPAAGNERLELLEAVVRQMRAALGRLRRGLAQEWEDGEICLALLQHLAQRDEAGAT